MKRLAMLGVLLVVRVVAACGGDDPGPAPTQSVVCPPWEVRVVGADGGAHCVIAGDTVNAPGDCAPVACQAYDSWGVHGDGGAGAILCAAACEAHCSDDPRSEALDLAEAAEAGMTCIY